jgi:hypothetical protein
MALDDAAAPSDVSTTEERHASWLELFFDLVSVSGFGMMAHLLSEDSTSGGVALYLIALVAYWLVWACFTAYANIAGERTHVGPMLVGMAALGVMTAAVPEIHGEHARAFAIAYVVGRVAATRPWRVTTVVVDLPVVHASLSVLPWIISLWFDGTTQYMLWGAGLVIDVVLLLTTRSEELLANSQARLDRMKESMTRRNKQREQQARVHRGGPVPGPRDVPTTVTAAMSDLSFLGERLGLFILIVLGEGLVQTIDAASEAHWDRHLALAGAGAFAVVIGVWFLGVYRGFAGLALVDRPALSPRVAWATHLAVTATLATTVSVLGPLVANPTALVPAHDRRVLAVAYLGYGLLCAAVHLTVGVKARRRATPGGPARVSFLYAAWVGGPIVAAGTLVLLASERTAQSILWLLAAGVLVPVVARRWLARERRPSPDRTRPRPSRGPRRS